MFGAPPTSTSRMWTTKAKSLTEQAQWPRQSAQSTVSTSPFPNLTSGQSETSTNTTITLSRGTSAIANVEADDTNAPMVYYDLQGMRVENPANGVFIRVQGSQVTKIAK